MSTATVVVVPNPFRPRARHIERVPAGTRLGDVAAVRALPGFDAGRFTARVDGAKAEAGAELGDGGFAVVVGRPAGIETLTTVGLNILLATVVSFAFMFIFPPPKPKQSRGDDESPTYSFGGVGNNRTEGQPIPVVYGKTKIGGTIVNEFVDTVGLPPKTTLYQLISFGEGPIHSIAGIASDTPAISPISDGAIPVEIAINGNPAQNFTGVKAWVRLGTNEQESIPGFDGIRQTFALGSEFLSPELPGNNTASIQPGFSVASDDEFTAVNDSIWDEYAISFDYSSEEVDGYIVRLQFPQGYYATDQSSGAALPVGLIYQVRYRELDGSSIPIATGGYNNDGWVRLPVEGPVSLSQRSPFEFQVRGDFYDPQSYTPATPGFAFESTSGTTSRVDFAAGAGMGFNAGFEIPEMTSLGWVNPTSLPASPIAGSKVWLWGDLDSGSERGAGIFLEYRTFAGNGTPQSQWVLSAAIGRGTRIITTYAGTAYFGGDVAPTSLAGGMFNAAALNIWTHIAFQYVQNDYIKLYVNGTLIPTRTTANNDGDYDLEWEGNAVHIGYNPGITATQFLGKIDEVKIYRAEIGDVSVRGDFGSGIGTTNPIPGFSQSLILRAAFDAAGGGPNDAPGNWYQTGAVIGSGVTTGTATGLVRVGLDGVQKRGSYRVEILRVSRSSSDASVVDDIVVESFQSVVALGLTYPNSPILGLQIPASEQLNQSIPTTTAVVKGRLVPIWDGGSIDFPAIRRAWSANPAWIALDIITDRRFGLGRFYSIRDVDLVSFNDWAQYCDTVVYDGGISISMSNALSADDILFDNSTADPVNGLLRGSLQLHFGITGHSELPNTWEPGHFIRISDAPTDADDAAVLNDINSVDGAGYEIKSVELVAGFWVVTVYWDRLGEDDPWTSGEFLAADTLTDPDDINTTVATGGHRRFEFNGVFDSTSNAWDALLDVCAVGRAVTIREGSRIRIRYSAPRQPVGLLTAQNIIEGSFRCDISSSRERANAITLSILDEQQGYEPVPVAVQDESIESSADSTFIRQDNRQLFGVTDAAQAERHGRFILNTNRLLLRRGSFSASLDALPFEVGDLLRVSSDVMPRGDGGRALATSAPFPPGLLTSATDLGAWTANGGAVVATNVASDPFGGTLADRITGGYVSRDLVGAPFADGWVCVACFVKDSSSGVPTIALATPRGISTASYSFATGVITERGSINLPVKAKVQACGSGWFYFWAAFFVKAPDGVDKSSGIELQLYPQLTGSAAAIFSRVSVTRSEHPACNIPGRMIVVDRRVVVSGAETNTLYLQDFRGNLISGTVDTAITPAGTYYPGSVLFLSAALAAPPLRGNPYLVARASHALVVELVNAVRNEDLSVDFDWIEYNADVFDDDATAIGEFGGAGPASPGGGGLNGAAASGVVPLPVEELRVSDILTEPSPGAFMPELSVAWRHAPRTRAAVTGSAVFVRLGAQGASLGAWTLAATASGLASSVSFVPSGARPGGVVEVAVVALSRARSVGVPEQGARTAHTIVGLGAAPPPPSGLTLSVAGLLGSYGWTPPSGPGAERLELLDVVLRRGGWILGQPIGSAPASVGLDKTQDIFAPISDASIGRVYACAMNRAAAFSVPTYADFDPAIEIDGTAPDIIAGNAVEWETHVAGSWVFITPAVGDPQLSAALEVGPDGEVTFASGSSLTGTYTTASQGAVPTTIEQSRPPRDLFITAAVEAEQVHPLLVGDSAFTLGSPAWVRWSFEGPTHNIPADQARNCTLAIQIRVNLTGTSTGWGPWQNFRPGIYRAVDVQYRLLVTRNSEDFNVRVRRFHTRAEIPRRSIDNRNTMEFSAIAEIL